MNCRKFHGTKRSVSVKEYQSDNLNFCSKLHNVLLLCCWCMFVKASKAQGMSENNFVGKTAEIVRSKSRHLLPQKKNETRTYQLGNSKPETEVDVHSVEKRIDFVINRRNKARGKYRTDQLRWQFKGEVQEQRGVHNLRRLQELHVPENMLCVRSRLI